MTIAIRSQKWPTDGFPPVGLSARADDTAKCIGRATVFCRVGDQVAHSESSKRIDSPYHHGKHDTAVFSHQWPGRELNPHGALIWRMVREAKPFYLLDVTGFWNCRKNFLLEQIFFLALCAIAITLDVAQGWGRVRAVRCKLGVRP